MNKKTMKETFTCPICIEKIVDDSSERDGDDSILCEVICASWLHRKCTGFSKDAFAKIGDPNTPFHCPSCRMDKLDSQRSMQEESVSAQEVTTLKIELTTPANPVKELQSSLLLLLQPHPLPLGLVY